METQDALQIVDFKTSRCRWSADQIAESSGQLLLYSQLAGDLCPKPVKLSFLWSQSWVFRDRGLIFSY